MYGGGDGDGDRDGDGDGLKVTAVDRKPSVLIVTVLVGR